MTTISLIVAAHTSGGIGNKGELPWRLAEDMKHFKTVTTMTESGPNAVIMGRKTWESIPSKFRPLPGRTNIVLSRSFVDSENQTTNSNSADYPEDVILANSIDDAISKLPNDCGKAFCIGGGEVYKSALDSGKVGEVYLTEVEGEGLEFDAYFPKLEKGDYFIEDVGGGEKVDKKSGLKYKFLKYSKVPEGDDVNPEEMQYLDLCRDVIENGVKRGDRTGTGTLSKFGVQMRFSLRNDTMPLLTTKRVFWRGVAEELIWFVRGCTNANELADKDIHIWDGNGSREFLDGRGLTDREVGDLGPVYGFQWRHFGAKYTNMHADYKGQGVDQLAECIEKIKNNPTDRRIICSAWNPADLSLMALPPCHMFVQFFVDTEKGELSAQMYQRSADLGLGVPFNIASYSLLVHMMAQMTGLKPGEFVHVIGDAHVYLNHVDAIKEQLKRKPRPFPKLKLNLKEGETKELDDWEYKDFTIEGYKPQKTIKMKMAV